MWEKLYRLGDALSPCCWNVDTVAPIVLGGASQVPAVDTVRGPGASLVWCFKHQHFGAGGSQGGSIEIECPIQLCLSREARIDPGGPEQIEGQRGLGEEAVPQM